MRTKKSFRLKKTLLTGIVFSALGMMSGIYVLYRNISTKTGMMNFEEVARIVINDSKTNKWKEAKRFSCAGSSASIIHDLQTINFNKFVFKGRGRALKVNGIWETPLIYKSDAEKKTAVVLIRFNGFGEGACVVSVKSR